MKTAIAATAVALVTGSLIVWVLSKRQPHTVRGTPTTEFTLTAPTAPRPASDWPTYGGDAARTHAAAFRLRPPFRRVWAVFGDASFIHEAGRPPSPSDI